MDISSATTAQVSAPADTNASTKTQKTPSGDSSFKNEMDKVSIKDESKAETKSESNAETKSESKAKSETDLKEQNSETNVAVKTDEKTDMMEASVTKHADIHQDLSAVSVLSGSIGMTANLQNPNMNAFNDTQALIDANMQLYEVVSDAKIPSKVDYTTVQMDMNDTKFFTDLVQNTDKTMQNVMTELSQSTEAEVKEVQKNIKVSATLMNALSEAVKNKQSFRIDFDKDISVIIRVDRDGSLSAKFIPGDSAVEQYLKQNISTLRQRFDEQELPYKELSHTGQQKRERKNNENNKEKQS